MCDESRRLDFRVAELRDGIERFPMDFGSWLETPAGRFAQWLAVRDR